MSHVYENTDTSESSYANLTISEKRKPSKSSSSVKVKCLVITVPLLVVVSCASLGLALYCFSEIQGIRRSEVINGTNTLITVQSPNVTY